MGDWINDLTPNARTRWDEFVEHFRRDALEKISDSAMTISIVPERGWDVKFAVELGASIMLNKPIMAVVAPGASIPAKFEAIADEIVVADLDTEEGREAIHHGITKMIDRLKAGEL